MARWTCSESSSIATSASAAPGATRATRPSPSGRAANDPLDVRDDLVVVDVAGDGDGHRAGAVVLGEEGARCRRRDRPHGRPLASGVTAEAVVAEHLAGERAHGDVVGSVVVHRQLLEDHLALALDVVVGELRGRQHVTEQLEPGRPRGAAACGSSRPCTPSTVKALMSPPTRSTAREMSVAERVAVPLNSRCSRKWLTPATAAPARRASRRRPTRPWPPTAPRGRGRWRRSDHSRAGGDPLGHGVSGDAGRHVAVSASATTRRRAAAAALPAAGPARVAELSGPRSPSSAASSASKASSNDTANGGRRRSAER